MKIRIEHPTVINIETKITWSRKEALKKEFKDARVDDIENEKGYTQTPDSGNPVSSADRPFHAYWQTDP